MSDHWSHLPYRPCVGVMVLNGEGKVWIGHRLAEGNTEYSGSPNQWRGSQVVRQKFAKLPFAGSIPALASKEAGSEPQVQRH